MSLYFRLLIAGTVLFFVSCGKTKEVATKKSNIDAKTEVKKLKPIEKSAAFEDFDSFYNKFHMDSVFQMKRIKFPLQGYDMDTSEQVSSWNKNNWIMHRSKITEVDTIKYEVEIQTTKSERKERIYIDGGGFSSERVFKRINGKWYLTLFNNEEI